MDRYKCSITTKDGSTKDIYRGNSEDIVMITYISMIGMKHSVIIKDCIFIKKFRRVFTKVGTGNTKQSLEVLHCVITDKYRFYLKDRTGETFVTPKDYDMYL